MNLPLDDTLFHVAEKTLENLAFLFCSPEEGDPGGVGPFQRLGVSFSGPFKGRLTMDVSAGVLPELAANMLGMDEAEVSSEEQQDAAAEALNVICGNLLPEIAGKQAVFDIDAPELLAEPADGGVAPGLTPRARATLALENGICDLLLLTETGALADALPAAAETTASQKG
jgi:hypothetical protein